jgi:glucosamine--fructose-6-phosphate aminotransferase (isomerizing)
MTLSQKYATHAEITAQPEAWQQALDLTRAAQLPKAENYDQVIFTGCGSTYYLSLAAAALYQELTGRSARAVPGGELLLNPLASVAQIARGASPNGDNLRYLLVAISRSGTTTETVKAVEKFKAGKLGDVVVISNYDEVLSRSADTNILISKGQEESVAQTRSFASMYVAVTGFAASMAGRNDLLDCMSSLPETGERLIRDFEPAARQIGENLEFDRFYFLGSGIRYGLACEVNLKMKEMTLTHSEPFHFLEFRHGPMSMVNEKAVIVGLVSESNLSHEKAVLNEMQALGGKIVALAELDADITFQSGIPETVRGVLYLPVLQLMAFYRSLSKGLNPDRPNNLSAVIKLDL